MRAARRQLVRCRQFQVLDLADGMRDLTHDGHDRKGSFLFGVQERSAEAASRAQKTGVLNFAAPCSLTLKARQVAIGIVTQDIFAADLACACSLYISVAEVCRCPSINRQRFNEYLASQVHPSRHNMRKIRDFFGVTEWEILMEEKHFIDLLSMRLQAPLATEFLRFETGEGCGVNCCRRCFACVVCLVGVVLGGSLGCLWRFGGDAGAGCRSIRVKATAGVGEIGAGDLGSGAVEADGSSAQAEAVLLLRDHGLDAGT